LGNDHGHQKHAGSGESDEETALGPATPKPLRQGFCQPDGRGSGANGEPGQYDRGQNMYCTSLTVCELPREESGHDVAEDKRDGRSRNYCKAKPEWVIRRPCVVSCQ
jgi:hypothetical protein